MWQNLFKSNVFNSQSFFFWFTNNFVISISCLNVDSAFDYSSVSVCLSFFGFFDAVHCMDSWANWNDETCCLYFDTILNIQNLTFPIRSDLTDKLPTLSTIPMVDVFFVSFSLYLHPSCSISTFLYSLLYEAPILANHNEFHKNQRKLEIKKSNRSPFGQVYWIEMCSSLIPVQCAIQN